MKEDFILFAIIGIWAIILFLGLLASFNPQSFLAILDYFVKPSSEQVTYEVNYRTPGYHNDRARITCPKNKMVEKYFYDEYPFYVIVGNPKLIKDKA